MPPPFIMGGGGAYSITLVRTSIRTYVCTYVHPLHTKNGFRAISFEYIGVLDSYFIHRYTSIKYRSSSITYKFHWLLSELWPLISNEKWFPGDIFWIHWCIGFIFHTQVYNHKTQVKLDYRQNPPIIIRVMALDLRMKNGFRAISFEYIDPLDSYFIHRYIIIKYRSSSIMGKIHQLLSELWPLISVWKMVSGRYLLNTLVNWIHISYTGI